MLGENLKALRKQRGMSQEVMAQQLNVVRQTVSKWEQGLSVPDAQMLTRIAELFEVPVSSLLGEKIEEKADMAENAAQLAVLNEQLAAKTKRSKRIFKILLAVFAGIILVYALLIACNMVLPAKRITGAGDENRTVTTLDCRLDGQRYIYSIVYEEDGSVIAVDKAADSDAQELSDDPADSEEYTDAKELIAGIDSYFEKRGGSVRRTDKTD